MGAIHGRGCDVAVELAAAYLTLVPSLRGAQRQIQAQIGPAATEAGTMLGDELRSGVTRGLDSATISAAFTTFGKGAQEVGGKLSKWITAPAVIAGTAVSGLVGALGFKRLVGIDTARGQFQGLGYDADAVMQQVDRGVTNTALSMAQGASTAVGILATGNVPLEGLEDQIKRVANVSAAYNVDAEQAAYLLNNILTKNKVTWGDLSQMQQNQIPVVTALADHYGVAGDAIMDMAQNGEISIEDLNAALDAEAGAAAEAYAGTWQGMTENIMSNIGRLGAEVLDGVFPQMKVEIADFLELLRSDEAKEFAQQVGGFLSDAFVTVSDAVKGAIQWFTGLSPTGQKLVGVLAGVAVAAGPVISVVGKISTGIGSLITGVGKGITAFKKFSGAIRSGAETMQLVAMYGWDKLKSGAQTVQLLAMYTWGYVKAGAAKLASLAAQAGMWVKSTAAMVAQRTAMVASTVATKAVTAAQWLFNAALNANPIGIVVAAVAALVAGLIWFFTQTELGQEIWANFTQFLREAWDNIVNFVQAAWENIVSFFTTFGQTVSDVWNSIWSAISDFFTGIWDGIVGFITAYVTTVQTIITTVVNTVKNVWNNVWGSIKTFFSNIWSSIVDAAKKYLTAVRDNFTRVIDFVKGIPDKILGFFKNMGTWLLNSGKALVDGFLTGIKNAWSRLTGWVSDGLQAVRDLFPFSPAKTGPFSGRGWVLNSGLSIGEAFGAGIASSLHDARGDVRDELAGIQDEFSTFDEQQFFAGFDVPELSHFRPASLTPAQASAAASDRPIYADGVGLVGWIRELANGEARLVVAGEAGRAGRGFKEVL